MRSLPFFLPLLVVFLSLLTGCDRPGTLPVYTPVKKVALADPVLLRCLIEVAAERGWERAGDVLELHCNNPEGPGVSNLAGLELLPNLQVVNLAHNEISDARQVIELKHLVDADLGYNAIEGIPSKYSHLSLTRLNLDHNRLRKLDWLDRFPRLNTLSVAHNQISDLRPLQHTPEMQDLNFEHNRISDISPLGALQSLRWLDIGNNEVSSLEPMVGLEKLKALIAEDNQIVSITSLALLKQLDELSLAGNPITDIAPLSGLSNLRRLDLDRTAFHDAGPLEVLGNLQQLSVKQVPGLSCEMRARLISELGDDVVNAGSGCIG